MIRELEEENTMGLWIHVQAGAVSREAFYAGRTMEAVITDLLHAP